MNKVKHNIRPGDKYGKLTIISYYSKDKHRNVRWTCVCECGTYKNVLQCHLLTGKIVSCGCSKHSNKVQVGFIFGRLMVIEYIHHTKSGHSVWKCQCKCGTIKEVRYSDLVNKSTRSCGCLQKELNIIRNTIHGESDKHITKEYNTWDSIKQRCLNPNDPQYAYYGGQGISICLQWRDNYLQFLADVGRAPSKKHSIHRINNNGNYEPNNIKWALADEQNNNRGSYNVLITYNNKTQTIAEWSRETGIGATTLRYREKAGWLSTNILNMPIDAQKGWRKGQRSSNYDEPGVAQIYILFDPTWQSNKFYIGKSNNPKLRLSKHLSLMYLKAATDKNQWIKELLVKGIRPQVITICKVPSYITWRQAEKSWIAFFLWCGLSLVNS